jgi:hypothetical protein
LAVNDDRVGAVVVIGACDLYAWGRCIRALAFPGPIASAAQIAIPVSNFAMVAPPRHAASAVLRLILRVYDSPRIVRALGQLIELSPAVLKVPLQPGSATKLAFRRLNSLLMYGPMPVEAHETILAEIQHYSSSFCSEMRRRERGRFSHSMNWPPSKHGLGKFASAVIAVFGIDSPSQLELRLATWWGWWRSLPMIGAGLSAGFWSGPGAFGQQRERSLLASRCAEEQREALGTFSGSPRRCPFRSYPCPEGVDTLGRTVARHRPVPNGEFNLLNANLVVPASCEFNFKRTAVRLH